jgi:DNA-directed RNA polymerase subunit RPC12/RpoP
MTLYKVWKTGELLELSKEELQTSFAGGKILLKVRPPVAKTLKTD